jgi:hypothetical protein
MKKKMGKKGKKKNYSFEGNFYNSSSESYETSLYFEIVFKKQ